MYQWVDGWHDGAELVDATFENAAIGIAHVGLDGSWLRVNERLLEILGYSREELLAITFQDITHPDDLKIDLEQLRALIKGDIPHYQMEKRYFRKDGQQIWANLTVGLQRGRDGKPDFCISLIEDITRRKADEDHLRIMIDELNHRVKNTLATVQAVAHMSFRKDEPLTDAKADFTGRLQALSSAHDILTDEKWTGADIRQVIERALRPFSDDDCNNVTCEGGRIRLMARQAMTFTMAINELMTNAIKYGALSNDDGAVALSWRRVSDGGTDMIQLDWIERGGPPCAPPERRGFGTTLLTKILPGDFRGSATLDYAADGLEYRLWAPWPAGGD